MTEQEQLLDLMDAHLTRYPEMNPNDLYKLAHQAVYGVGHMVTSEDAAVEALAEELDAMDMEPRSWEEAAEIINPAREMARIHLRPFLRNGGESRRLAAAMVKTVQLMGTPRANVLAKVLGLMRPRLKALGGDFDRSGFDVLLRDMATQQFPAVHHSEAFRDIYDPHYRVVLLEAFEVD